MKYHNNGAPQDIPAADINRIGDENPEIYLFYLQNIKNNTSKQNYKARHKHQTIMILTIITCRKPNQNNTTT